MSGEFELVLQRATELDPLFIIHGGDTVYTGEEIFRTLCTRSKK